MPARTPSNSRTTATPLVPSWDKFWPTCGYSSFASVGQATLKPCRCGDRLCLLNASTVGIRESPQGCYAAIATHMTKSDITGIAPFFIIRNVPAVLSFYRDRLGFDITFKGSDPDDIFFGIV